MQSTLEPQSAAESEEGGVTSRVEETMSSVAAAGKYGGFSPAGRVALPQAPGHPPARNPADGVLATSGWTKTTLSRMAWYGLGLGVV